MQLKQVGGIVALFLLIACFLCSCGEQKRQAKAQVVSKRIVVSKPTAENDVEPAKQTDPSAPAEQQASEDTVTEIAATRIYDPANRQNPFTRLFKTEQKETVAQVQGTEKRKKREPRTPLEKISIDQLNLVAIVRASSGNRALMEDSSGKGFIVHKGTYVGLNSGIVTQINESGLVVEEELENLMGELTLQHTEIKLQKPAGE
jgi:type IV pilus assembly protein PilP